MLIVAFCNFAKAPKNRQGNIYHVGAVNAYGGVKAMLHPFLTLVLDEGCGKFHVPAAVPSGKKPHGTHWLGPRANLNAFYKSRESSHDSSLVQLLGFMPTEPSPFRHTGFEMQVNNVRS
jgi:hypothetical protein